MCESLPWVVWWQGDRLWLVVESWQGDRLWLVVESWQGVQLSQEILLLPAVPL